MNRFATPTSLPQQAALMATGAQVGLLCAWATGSIWALGGVLLLALCGIVLLDTTVPGSQRGQSILQYLLGPRVQQASAGGLGMLLGTWVDAEFRVPPCMCCRYSPHTQLFTLLVDHLWALGTLGMVLGCAAAMVWGAVAQRRSPTLEGAISCATEMVGMGLGMMAIAAPAAAIMRRMPWGKLELGHGLMVVAMALGAWVCTTLAEAIAASATNSDR